MFKQVILLGSVGIVLIGGCTGEQRSQGLANVRRLQTSGVALAAEAGPAGAATSSLGAAVNAPTDAVGTMQGLPPGPPGGGAPPPPDAQVEAPATSAAGTEAEKESAPSTPEEIIKDFVESDPREILEQKRDDLKARQTAPWDDEKPESFIAETGRKDPMTILRKSVPEELLPPRSADEDDSDLESYYSALLATTALQQVTQSLRCHSVIQIGIQKYAQLSFEGQGGRFVISEGQGFNQNLNLGGAQVQVAMNIVSISTKEVVVSVVVGVVGTNTSVSKDLVFIPRN